MKIAETKELLNRMHQEVIEYASDDAMYEYGRYWISWELFERIVNEVSKEEDPDGTN